MKNRSVDSQRDGGGRPPSLPGPSSWRSLWSEPAPPSESARSQINTVRRGEERKGEEGR